KPQFHRSGPDLDGFSTARQHLIISTARIMDPEAHAACRRPVLRCEIGSGRARLIVSDQIYATLPPEIDTLRPVTRNMREAERRESRFQKTCLRRAEFNEFKPIKADRIIGLARHG